MDRPRALVPLVVAAGLLALLLFAGSGSGEPEAVDDTLPPPVSTPTTAVVPTTLATASTLSSEEEDRRREATRRELALEAAQRTEAGDVIVHRSPLEDVALGELIPGFNGRLTVITGSGDSGFEVTSRSAESPDLVGSMRLTPSAEDIAVDYGGGLIAYTTHQPNQEGSSLWVVPLGGNPVLVTSKMHGYRWSSDEPGRLAIIEDIGAGDGWRLTEARLTDDAGAIDWQGLDVVDPDSEIVGLNSSGWWVLVPDANGPYVAHQGERASYRHAADIVFPEPDGDTAILGAFNQADWNMQFVHVSGEVTPLSWAPSNVGGEYGWAALAGNDHVAWIGSVDTSHSYYWLEVWDIAGLLPQRNEFPFRIWNVSWSHDDRFVLMPGTDDRGSHFVLIHDTQRNVLTALAQDDRVQYVAVTP